MQFAGSVWAVLQIVRLFNDDDDGEQEEHHEPLVTNEGRVLHRLPGQHHLLGWHLVAEDLAFLASICTDIDADEYADGNCPRQRAAKYPRTHLTVLRRRLERERPGLGRRIEARRGGGGAYRIVVEDDEHDMSEVECREGGTGVSQMVETREFQVAIRLGRTGSCLRGRLGYR